MAITDIDPNKVLAAIRAEVSDLRSLFEVHHGMFAESAECLVNHMVEIDEWLSKGGYPPAAWDPFSKTPPE